MRKVVTGFEKIVFNVITVSFELLPLSTSLSSVASFQAFGIIYRASSLVPALNVFHFTR